jgi:hypothetical protein
MRIVLVSLMTVFVLASFAQPDRHVDRVIFFQKPKDYHLRHISEGEFCIVATKPRSREFEGNIKRISHDSIFISDTVFPVRNITYIRFIDELKSPILLTDPEDMPVRYILFPKDTVIWKVKIPPASIFQSSWNYHNYVKHYEDSAKRALHYQRMPGHYKEKSKYDYESN